MFTLTHHRIQQGVREDDDSVQILESRHLRLSHLFPRQPDGQSQTSGPTHLPPFIHMGSHTPAGREGGIVFSSMLIIEEEKEDEDVQRRRE